MSIDTSGLPKQMGELIDEIQRRGIFCRQISKTIMVVAIKGNQRHILSQYSLPIIPHNYTRLLDNKKNFKAILKHLEIPYVLQSRCFLPKDVEKAVEYAEKKIGFPVICKPIFGMNMQLVFCGIQNELEFNQIWQQHFLSLVDSNNEVLVEKYFENASDHRFICFKDGTKAVIKDSKPRIIGDGISTIAHLIQLKNSAYQKEGMPFKAIPATDFEIQRCLQSKGYTLNSIPSLGKTVDLLYATDRHKGATYEVIDLSNIHSSYWELVQQVWNIFPKMPFFALDILSTDLSLPTHPDRTAINEAAVGPTISEQVNLEAKQEPNLIENLVDILFPDTRARLIEAPIFK